MSKNAFRSGSGTAEPLGWVESWNCYQGFLRGSGFPKAPDCDGSRFSGIRQMCPTKSFSQLESRRGNRNFSKGKAVGLFKLSQSHPVP